MESRLTRLDYCQFLLSSQVNYTLTHFAEHSRRFSHDLANCDLWSGRTCAANSPPVHRATSSLTTRCWASPTQAASPWCAASTAATSSR